MHTEIESWSVAVSMFLRSALVPGRLRKMAATVPPLRQMRVMFLAFCTGLLLILFMLWWVVPSDGGYPAGYLILWVVFTAVALPAVWFFRKKRNRVIAQLDSSDEALNHFRTSMFAEVAFAEAIGLVGFILSMALETLLPYVVALPVSLLAMALISPTARSIRNLQALIDEGGGSLRMVDALMGVDARSS